MSRLPVQPTKSNLLRLQEELDFAETGHQLLQEKREILLMRIRSLIEELREKQAELYAALNTSYHRLSVAALTLGWQRLDAVHVRPNQKVSVSLEPKHYMGIDLPHLSLAPLSSRPRYSPSGTNSHLDAAQTSFIEFLPHLVEYAQREAHLFALSLALKQTMKRVNALENIFIPDYNDTVDYVSDTLEELEREEMYIRKLVKEKGQAKGRG